MGGFRRDTLRLVSRFLGGTRSICGLVFLVALAIRAAYLLDIRGTPLSQLLLIDSETYDRLARLILAGNFEGEEVYAMNPLYPYFLALIYAIGGGARMLVLVVQAGLDAASCAMIAWLGLRFFGTGTALIAGLGAAFYGPLVFYSGALLTPTLILFLLLVAFVLLARWIDEGRGRLCFWAGVCLGFAALGRGSNALLVPLLLIAFRAHAGSWRRALGPWLRVFVGATLVVGVLVVRNRIVEDRFVPISANVAAFYLGHNPEATGIYQMPSFTTGAAFKDEVWGTRDALSRRLGRELTLAEASSWLVREGISFATHHPLEEAKLLALKFYYFWNRTESATNLSYYFARDFSSVLRGVPLGFGVVAPLALLGILLNRRRWREHVFLHVFWLNGLLTALIFFVSAEYRIPALPPLLLFAANAPLIVAGWLGWRMQRHGPGDTASARVMAHSLTKNVLVAGGCLVAFALFCNARDERMRFQSLKRVDYLNFGVLYKEKGDLDGAESMFRRSLAIDAKYAPAYAELADIEHRRGNELEAARLAAEARRYRPAESPAPTPGAPDVQGLMLQAGTLYQAKQYPEALKLFTAIRNHAAAIHDAELGRSALNNIGLCKFQMGELDTAAIVFQSLMAEAPTYVKPVNNLAKVRLAEGQKAEAAALFRKALEIDPQNRIAREELAKLQP